MYLWVKRVVSPEITDRAEVCLCQAHAASTSHTAAPTFVFGDGFFDGGRESCTVDLAFELLATEPVLVHDGEFTD